MSLLTWHETGRCEADRHWRVCVRSEGWRGERWWWWGVCHGGRGHKSKLSASRSKFPIESDLSTIVNVYAHIQ